SALYSDPSLAIRLDAAGPSVELPMHLFRRRPRRGWMLSGIDRGAASLASFGDVFRSEQRIDRRADGRCRDGRAGGLASPTLGRAAVRAGGPVARAVGRAARFRVAIGTPGGTLGHRLGRL